MTEKPAGNTPDQGTDRSVKTPMHERVAYFWRLLETEPYVRVLVEMRRATNGDPHPYWDSSSFPDDVVKAIVADRSADRKPREVRGDHMHTPTPWIAAAHFRERAGAREYIPIVRPGNDPVPIAVVHISVDGYGREEGEANAAFIVRAVNAYEANATALATQDARIKELERVLKDTHASLSEFRPILQRHLDNIFLLAPNDEQRAAVLNGNAYRTAVARVERMNTAIESAQLALKAEAR